MKKATPTEEQDTFGRTAHKWGTADWRKIDIGLITIANRAAVFTLLQEKAGVEPCPMMVVQPKEILQAVISLCRAIKAKYPRFQLRAALDKTNGGTAFLAIAQRPLHAPPIVESEQSVLDYAPHMHGRRMPKCEARFLQSLEIIPGMIKDSMRIFSIYNWPNFSIVEDMFARMRGPKKRQEVNELIDKLDPSQCQHTRQQAEEIFNKVFAKKK